MDVRRIVSRYSLLVLAFAACTEPLTEPPTIDDMATLQLYADVSQTDIAGLVVDVTAADIPEPLLFNLPVRNGIGQGTLTVPSGRQRRFGVRAFDGEGQETHHGEATVDVSPGDNPQLDITLIPLSGNVPVKVRVASLIVAVEPSHVRMRVGERVQLTAHVYDAQGRALNRPVQWGSTNPVFMSVDDNGVVTAHQPGEVEIIASVSTSRGTATVAAAPTSNVNGFNLTRVQFGNANGYLGDFVEIGNLVWQEQGATGTTLDFVEQGRDEWSVYLFDESRGVYIQLDLWTLVVYYSDANTSFPLYDIFGAQRVDGTNVMRVEYGNASGYLGDFLHVGNSAWQEQGADGARFDFVEQLRDDWSVYLYDEPRGIWIQLDLHTKTVYISYDGFATKGALYEIFAGFTYAEP